METLADFGGTLAIGVFFLLGLGFVIELCWPNTLLRYAISDEIPNSLIISFLAAIALTTGLLAENMSNLVVDKVPQVLSPMPNEKGLRANVLLGSLRDQYKNHAEALQLLRKAHVNADALQLLVQAEPPAITMETNVNEIYYTAKNIVYRNDNYYDELSSHQSRIDFSRSFTFTCLLISLFTLFSFVALVRPALGLNRMTLLKRLSFALLVFFALYWVGRYAYTAEEREFNKRTFGYFLVEAIQEK